MKALYIPYYIIMVVSMGVVLLTSTHSVFAQAPANDDCTNAQVLAVNPPDTCINTVSGTTVNATSTGNIPSCENPGNIQDVWFTFNSGTITALELNITLGTMDISTYEIFDACGVPNLSLSSICDGTPGSNIQQLITGFPGVPTTYFIRVWVNTDFNDSPGTFEICLKRVLEQSNDLCADADTLIVNDAGNCSGNSILGNTAGTTIEDSGPDCDLGGLPQDVWYVFNSGSSHSILFNIQLGSASYIGFEIFQACGLKDTLLTPYCYGDIDGQTHVSGFPGTPTTYYLRIWSNPDKGDFPGTFSICLEQLSTVPCNSLQFSYNVSDVSVSGGSDGIVDITVTGETPPYYYNWSNNSISEDITGLKAGAYVVTVHASNCFAVDSVIVGTLPPQSDLCQDAVNLIVNPYGDCPANGITGTTFGMALTGAEPVCESPGGAPQDIWFAFNSGNSASIIFDVELGSADFVGLEIFNACGVVDTLLIPGCVLGIFGTQEVTGFPGIPTDYYFRIWSNPGIGDMPGTFSICLSEAPPANDICGNPEILTIHAAGHCAFNAIQGNTTAASSEGADPNCDLGGVYQDVWYAFNSGSNTEIQLSITLGTTNITSYEIYNLCGVKNQSVSPACMLNIGTNTQQVITGFPGTPTAYLLRAWVNTGFGDVPGTFDICLSQPPDVICDSLKLSFDVTDVSIPGGSNGAIDMIVTGEAPPYSYLWSTGATVPDLDSLSSGVYNIKVFTPDCFVMDSVMIVEFPTPGNDACVNAETLTINTGGDCPVNTLTGTTAGATSTGEEPDCDLLGIHQDVWYTFNSGNYTSLLIDLQLGTASYAGIEIFNSCGIKDTVLSPGCVGNMDGQQIVSGFSGIPATYYIRVWSNPGFGDNPGTFTICLSEVCTTQDIPISIGWNMVSSYIDPAKPDVMDLIDDIADDILLVKNSAGQSAIPLFGINTIGDWKVEQGYKIKALNPVTLTIGCTQVDPAITPISVPAGWSIISYLRTTPMDVTLALNNVSADILLVKNAQGNSYIPQFFINTIGNMLPGQGYKAKMLNAAVLNYPANLKTSDGVTLTRLQETEHFIVNNNTGHNATIIIPAYAIRGISVGDEVAVFNQSGMLAGAAVFQGNNLAITAWGDDQTTNAIDGMETGEDFSFKIWSVKNLMEWTVNVTFEQGEAFYQDDGISIVKDFKKAEKVSGENELQVYPNPAMDELNISLIFSEDENLVVKVMDIYGKVILDHEKFMEKGYHTYTVNLSGLAVGLYLIQIRTGDYNQTVKIQKY